ncbi:hypothetical protein DNTS_031635 [Danionella cerebrum]|uniref:Rho-GAP domain-containing protein n=1 Tax=Danionella cerebrum TaxID=2873325 RepID=A0A553QVX9_9TELE|nr:hypothetical protein DNTS_031635 [Danionella translucida]
MCLAHGPLHHGPNGTEFKGTDKTGYERKGKEYEGVNGQGRARAGKGKNKKDRKGQDKAGSERKGRRRTGTESKGQGRGSEQEAGEQLGFCRNQRLNVSRRLVLKQQKQQAGGGEEPKMKISVLVSKPHMSAGDAEEDADQKQRIKQPSDSGSQRGKFGGFLRHTDFTVQQEPAERESDISRLKHDLSVTPEASNLVSEDVPGSVVRMRRGRRKPGLREKVFGCDLMEHLSSSAQDVPQVLRICSEFIEKHGVVDGIYRLSGVSSNTHRLRSEFDSEATPDLQKEVYLQDIHCVSSLCKAYFRELPNPLLTYQLYDRFAEAVAVHLEDERLLKIREVLKDLPAPHYRTLEFLMHHLVKMSTFASQTNMHSRNLAIVWAPNLLRSKDIEASGFNGTAAFMEVRVQSIVVEFILTHVPQLFLHTDSGASAERRKSLPSPSLLAGQEEPLLKHLPLQRSGNLSPGDGPLPMRPYHAIIDGTDRRKGSLKGRKWRSIFNLGGRLHDPRKKNKFCPKETEKTSLRPAKSMDSLSCGAFALEDSKLPPAAPAFIAAGLPEASAGVALVGGGVSSSYAVTYRRMGGAQVSMVTAGTPGSYKSLEPVGGAEGAEGGAKSPIVTSRAERRAGIHISGPFSVTVPLHITSGLALGVLHGGLNEREDEELRTPDGELQTNLSVEDLEDAKKDEEDEHRETCGAAPGLIFCDQTNAPEPDLHFEDLQEAFSFLDSMEGSTAQAEFSVEAPCFEEEEDEEDHKELIHTNICEKPKTSSTSFTLPGKSHSLPYKSRPFLPLFLSASSEDDYSPAEDEVEESDGGSEYEDMFCKSLPSTQDFQGLSWAEPVDMIDSCIDQSEVQITPPKENAQLNTIHQSEDGVCEASLRDDRKWFLMKDEKNEESGSFLLEMDEKILKKEEEAELEASEEDTYFGADSEPSSPNLIQSEIKNISDDEEQTDVRLVSEEQTRVRTNREDEDEEEEGIYSNLKEEEDTRLREELEENTGESEEESDLESEDLNLKEREVDGDGNTAVDENSGELRRKQKWEENVKENEAEGRDDSEQERDEDTKEAWGNEPERDGELEENQGAADAEREEEVEGRKEENDEDKAEREEVFAENMEGKDDQEEQDQEKRTEQSIEEDPIGEQPKERDEEGKEQEKEEEKDSNEEEERREVALNVERESNKIMSKTLPVVPPKPQISKLTALHLRNRLEKRLSQITDDELEEKQLDETEEKNENHREEKNKTPVECERDKNKAEEEKNLMDSRREDDKTETEAQRERLGALERKNSQNENVTESKKESEGKKDGDKRRSGVSLCFDEAVARASEKRKREKEAEM